MTTTTTPIVGVDFVMFPTRDLAAAVAFYGTTLGLPCSVHMPDRGFAEFEAGSVTLNVAMTENFPMGYHPNPNPVALHVDDVAAARQRSPRRGPRPSRATRVDTGVCHMAFFSDPDGNALMLHHRYTPQGHADLIGATPRYCPVPNARQSPRAVSVAMIARLPLAERISAHSSGRHIGNLGRAQVARVAKLAVDPSLYEDGLFCDVNGVGADSFQATRDQNHEHRPLPHLEVLADIEPHAGRCRDSSD